MVMINLLPWRARWQRYQLMVLCSLLGAAIFFAGLLAVVSYFVLTQQVCDSHKQLNMLLAEEERYNRKQKHLKTPFLTTPEVTPSEVLWMREQAALGWTALTDDYVEHVCFTSFSQSKRRLTFSGETRSVIDLTEFLLHWKGVQQMGEIKVDELQRMTANKFSFRFHIEAQTT